MNKNLFVYEQEFSIHKPEFQSYSFINKTSFIHEQKDFHPWTESSIGIHEQALKSMNRSRSIYKQFIIFFWKLPPPFFKKKLTSLFLLFFWRSFSPLFFWKKLFFKKMNVLFKNGTCSRNGKIWSPVFDLSFMEWTFSWTENTKNMSVHERAWF